MGPEDHIQVDLSDPENLGYAVQEIRKSLEPNGSRLDALVNNAGIGYLQAPLLEGSLQMWRDVLMSNREELMMQSKLFQRALHTLEQALAQSDIDKLETLIDQASQTRARWRMGKQPRG